MKDLFSLIIINHSDNPSSILLLITHNRYQNETFINQKNMFIMFHHHPNYINLKILKKNKNLITIQNWSKLLDDYKRFQSFYIFYTNNTLNIK